MSEYLDRKQVIELYEKYQPSLATNVYEFGEKLKALPMMTLPVAELDTTKEDSDRPHGEWIEHRTQDCFGFFHSEYECSKCHNEVWQKTEWHFCPNCGSDNRPKEGEAK